jgi:hypothetical protein
MVSVKQKRDFRVSHVDKVYCVHDESSLDDRSHLIALKILTLASSNTYGVSSSSSSDDRSPLSGRRPRRKTRTRIRASEYVAVYMRCGGLGKKRNRYQRDEHRCRHSDSSISLREIGISVASCVEPWKPWDRY